MDIRKWLWKNRMNIEQFCKSIPMSRTTFYRIFDRKMTVSSRIARDVEAFTKGKIKFSLRRCIKREKKSS